MVGWALSADEAADVERHLATACGARKSPLSSRRPWSGGRGSSSGDGPGARVDDLAQVDGAAGSGRRGRGLVRVARSRAGRLSGSGRHDGPCQCRRAPSGRRRPALGSRAVEFRPGTSGANDAGRRGRRKSAHARETLPPRTTKARAAIRRLSHHQVRAEPAAPAAGATAPIPPPPPQPRPTPPPAPAAAPVAPPPLRRLSRAPPAPSSRPRLRRRRLRPRPHRPRGASSACRRWPRSRSQSAGGCGPVLQRDAAGAAGGAVAGAGRGGAAGRGGGGGATANRRSLWMPSRRPPRAAVARARLRRRRAIDR